MERFRGLVRKSKESERRVRVEREKVRESAGRFNKSEKIKYDSFKKMKYIINYLKIIQKMKEKDRIVKR